MKQKKIQSGESAALTGQIELYKPDKKAFDYFVEKFSYYTVPYLRDFAASLFPLVKNCKVVGEGAVPFVEKIVTEFQAKPITANKTQLLDFLALFLADHRNFSIYLLGLPDEVKRLWEYVVMHGCISRSSLKRFSSFNWLTISEKSYGWGSEVQKSDYLVWFEVKAGDPSFYEKGTFRYVTEHYIRLPDFLCSRMIPLFIEKDVYTIAPLAELPATAEKLLCFNAEPFIFTELPVLDGLSRQGELDTNEKGKLPAASLKKVATKMGMTEFFKGEETRPVAALRANMVLSAFAFYWMSKVRDISHPEEALKDIFGNTILNYPTILLPILLPYISGLRSSEFKESSAMRSLRDVFRVVIGLKSQDWISVSQLLLHCRINGVNLLPFSEYQLLKMELKNKLNDDAIYRDGWLTDLSEPFVKAFVFLLASFGLVEIAYEEFSSSTSSPFSTLRYFRLTALGTYVFGLSKTYELPKVKDEGPYFELDTRNLIVRSLGDNNPYESLLQDISEPIGRHRYKVTHASLLKSCATYEDVFNKMEFFKRFISNELPDIWTEFFLSLTKRCRPLKEIASEKYLIYQLDANNKELLHLVSTDPVIRKSTIRAEGHLLLVEKNSIRQITAHLKSFGYLL